MNCPPILIIGFNRPDFMRDMLGTLAPFRPRKLYFAVDGPRPGHPDDVEKCKLTANEIKSVNWPCEIHTRIREANLGCKYAPPDAISWFFENEEAGVILEDDCRPTESFLRYAGELLDRYSNEPQIGMVSGDCGYGFITSPDDSYRFTRAAHIWGWASWRRVWRLYDVDPSHFEADFQEILSESFLTPRGRHLMTCYYREVLAHNDTWDVQFALTLRRHRLLSIAPRESLVRNCGFISESTHTGGYSYDERHFAHAGALQFPLKHPACIQRDVEADRKEELRSFAWLPRILTVVGLRGGRLGRAICNLFGALEPHASWLFRI